MAQPWTGGLSGLSISASTGSVYLNPLASRNCRARHSSGHLRRSKLQNTRFGRSAGPLGSSAATQPHRLSSAAAPGAGPASSRVTQFNGGLGLQLSRGVLFAAAAGGEGDLPLEAALEAGGDNQNNETSSAAAAVNVKVRHCWLGPMYLAA